MTRFSASTAKLIIRSNSVQPSAAPAIIGHSRGSCKSGSDCQESSARANTALLIDHDAIHRKPIIESLTSRGLGVDLYASVEQAAKSLRRIDREYELIIVNISDSSQPWLRLLRFLLESSFQSGVAVGPSLLCVSTTEYDELFEFQIEGLGGRLEYER